MLNQLPLFGKEKFIMQYYEQILKIKKNLYHKLLDFHFVQIENFSQIKFTSSISYIIQFF